MAIKRSEKLENIKVLLQQEETVSTKQLTSLKISPALLHTFVEEGILLKVKRGVYKKGSCFPEEKIQTSIEHISFEAFEKLLQEGCYEKAGGSIDLVEVKEEEKARFYSYLRLLNQIVELPAEQQAWIQNFSFQECSERDYGNYIDHKIRLSIYNGKNKLALLQLEEKYEDTSMNLEDSIFYGLLEGIQNKWVADQLHMEQLQKNQDYNTLKEFLEKKETKGLLTKQEDLLLNLVRRIVMGAKKKIKVCTNTQSSTVFEAVANCDYACAKELQQKYLKETKIGREEDMIMGLLDELLSLAKEQEKAKESEHLFPQSSKKEKASSLKTLSLQEVFKQLFTGSTEDAIETAKQYFESKGNPVYANLAKDYIKIDAFHNDTCYETACNALFSMEKGTYSYHLLPQVLAFATCVEENPQEASLYLDIMKQGEKLGTPCVFLPALEKRLEEQKAKNPVKVKQ